MTLKTEKILDAAKKLDGWIEKNGWAGFDPYDLKAIPAVSKTTALGNRYRLFEILRETLFEIFYTFPVSLRKFLHIQPQVNAKAMALFSRSYLDLHIATGEKQYLDKSQVCLNWLLENSSNTSAGIAWGYPFDWQTDVLIPKFTPNGIVTTAAGDAFWGWYQFSKRPEFLDTCNEICEFLISLPVERISEEQICFAYTPLYQNHVHNLNLFVAEFLIKIGREINQQSWIELGQKAVNYTVANQRSDGSFDYNGPPEKPRNFSDNYHTGFVLRMLHSIWQMTGREDVLKSLERGICHYLQNFFEEGKIPKLLPDRIYRVDIHSCAESINCLCQLKDAFPEGQKTAGDILEWTLDTLQDPAGYFYYGLLKSRFLKLVFKSKIPYLRWGQAWMLKAISMYLLICSQNRMD